MANFYLRPTKVAVCVLLYADYFDLHRKILSSFLSFMPRDAHLFIWCNQTGKRTNDYLSKIQEAFPNAKVIYSAENKPKYLVMRELIHVKGAHPDQFDWFMWFDDDSYLKGPNFYPGLSAFIEKHLGANICYIGQEWYIHHRGNQVEFIKQAPWYTGRPLDMKPTKSKSLQPAAVFATGGWWMLRMDVLRTLDWPDRRLSHNGGDTLLGVAVQQQGLSLHNYSAHVAINQAPRRGISDKRAGE